MGAVDYEVEMTERKKEIRVYDINLLKKWCPPCHVYYQQEDKCENLEEEEDVQDYQFCRQEVTGIGDQGQHLKEDYNYWNCWRDVVSYSGRYPEEQM